jgi:hypothetical protein
MGSVAEETAFSALSSRALEQVRIFLLLNCVTQWRGGALIQNHADQWAYTAKHKADVGPDAMVTHSYTRLGSSLRM